MKQPIQTLLVAGLLLAGAQFQLHAQLVEDTKTLNFTGTTNLSGLIVGQYNGFTTLNIIAPGAVTNGGSFIGYGISSYTNRVTVQNSGAIWDNVGLYVGYQGRGNTLVVSNGGHIHTDSSGEVGTFDSAGYNSVLVTGTGSQWTMGLDLILGDQGDYNDLVISNGGWVANRIGVIGDYGGANSVEVTGTGSVWSNSLAVVLGRSTSISANRLSINNGGLVASADGMIGSFAGGNVVEVTDSGSR